MKSLIMTGHELKMLPREGKGMILEFYTSANRTYWKQLALDTAAECYSLRMIKKTMPATGIHVSQPDFHELFEKVIRNEYRNVSKVY